MRVLGAVGFCLFAFGCGAPPAPKTSDKPGTGVKSAAPPAPRTVPAPIEGLAVPRKPPGKYKEALEVPGHGKVLYALAVPRGFDAAKPGPLVLLLHFGYEGAKPEPHTGASMIDAFAPGLERLGAVLLAPDVLRGDWTDDVNAVTAVSLAKAAAKTYNVDPKKLAICGFSMGGEGVWSIGAKYPETFAAAIPVAAPIPNHMPAWKLPAFVIHSRADRVVPFAPAQRLADRLKSEGLEIEFRALDGLSHYRTGEYAPHVGEAAKWLQGRWEKTK